MEDEKPSARADLLAGLAFLAFGIAIIVGSLMMDRLERLQATIYTAPGLVPAHARADAGRRCGDPDPARDPRRRAVSGAAAVRMAASIGGSPCRVALCLAFALGLLGRGLPFWLGRGDLRRAVRLRVPVRGPHGARERCCAASPSRSSIGLISGLAIHYVFQDVFLVRLP